MAFLHNDVYDNGLNELTNDGDELHICSSEPTTYTQATSTNSLGSKSGPTISSPGNRAGGGREVTVSAISDGAVSDTGTATHYAIVDTTGSRLLATAALASSQAVTSGNPFTLTSFKIGIPAPA